MAIVVPLALLAVAIVIIAIAHAVGARRKSAPEVAEDQQARILVHSINDDRCTGCDACVVVCPTNVLELVSNKSRVLRFGDCIQCEQCMWACPTNALVMHWEDSEPPPLRVPALDPYYQTNVPGMYLIGEVAGKPLVKNAANVGRAVVEHMLQTGLRPVPRRRAEGSDPSLCDVAIVGSGPGGLSAALTCIHYGLSYVLLEKDQLVASTLARYPKGKEIMVEPYESKNVSFVPVFDSTKEELLPLWHELIERTGLRINKGEAVEAIGRNPRGMFDVRTTVGAYSAQRVVLATGTRGKPRTLGVPGENLPKVFTLLDDPGQHRGQHVIVVGGGDSAIEAALALADAGAKTTLSYRGRNFNRAQPKNKQRIGEFAQQGRVHILFGSNVTGFTADAVLIRLPDNSEHRVKNEAAFVLIGADPPVAWLEKLGVQYVERPHWYALGKTDQLVESLVGALPESPRAPAELAALVLRQAMAPAQPARERPPVPEPSVMVPLPKKPSERPALLPGMALDFGYGPAGAPPVLSSAQRPGPSREQPVALEEFAKVALADRPRKNKRPRGEDVTRLLRSLRDEGARLAHDESGIEIISASAVSGLSMASGVSGASRVSPVSRSPSPVNYHQQMPRAPEPLTGVSVVSSAPPPNRATRSGQPAPSRPSFVDAPTRLAAREERLAPPPPSRPTPPPPSRPTPPPPNRNSQPPAPRASVPPPSAAASKRPSFIEAPTRLADDRAITDPNDLAGLEMESADGPTSLRSLPIPEDRDDDSLDHLMTPPPQVVSDLLTPVPELPQVPTRLADVNKMVKLREQASRADVPAPAARQPPRPGPELSPWNEGDDYEDAEPLDSEDLEPVSGLPAEGPTALHDPRLLDALRASIRKK